ncbi:MAG: DnaA/Hda family protein [Gemmataceae bacterium]
MSETGMTPDAASLLEAAVANAVGTQRYELWFRSHVRFVVSDTEVVVSGKSEPFISWLSSTFAEELPRIASQTLGPKRTLRYAVNPAVFAVEPVAVQTEKSAKQPAGPKVNLFGETIQPPPSPAKVKPAEAKVGRRYRTLNDFVVGSCNRVAHAAAQMVVDEPGQAGNPVVFHGPVGVGKTHLLEGVYAGIRRHNPDMRPLFVTAEDFTSRAVQAMRFGKMAAFRSKYREASALIVDDLHVLAKKTATQEEFLYTFDALLADGKPIVVSMDCHPRLADELMPELVDRLLGGVIWNLMPPDDETRLALLKSKANAAGPLAFPSDVLTFLARNLRGNVRELEGAITAIRHFARVANRPIEIAIAREAVGDLLRHSVRGVTLAEIDAAVCRALHLKPGTLQSASKAWTVTHPRMAAIFLARKHTAATYGEIAKQFGVRQHSTAVAAEKRVRNWLAKGERVNVGDHEWPAADLLARIERELAK